MLSIPNWLSASIKLAIAASVFSILPSYITAVAEHTQFAPTLINYLATLELLGFALACAVNFILIRWRIIFNERIALIVLCLCHIFSAFTQEPSLFFVLRIIAGISAGLVVVRSYEVLGNESNPDAAFGKAIAVQMITTAILFLSLPLALDTIGSEAFFSILAILAGLAALLPRSIITSETTDFNNHHSIDYTSVLLSLSAVAMVMLTHTAVWSALATFASEHNVKVSDQGVLFAVGTLFSVMGAIISTHPKAHEHKKSVLTIAIMMQCFVVSVMLTGHDKISFIVASCLFQLLWNLILPLVMGSLASGKHGKVVIRFTLAAQTFGAALGPLVLVPGWVLPEVLAMLAVTYLLIKSIVVQSTDGLSP
ncbi:MFS transporter [Vibrio ulleungensis]|uniref:MFS transporter n=1 Tax=Vibrio ulleungensis TaxID=2807619 RepID=UPI001F27C13A|nr:MFS transporter [Vibrio ulleungensis]